MKRKDILWLTMRGIILGALLGAAASRASAAPAAATLTSVSQRNSPPASGDEVFLAIQGAYSSQATQIAPGIIFVDLKGVELGEVATSGEWNDGLLSGYRIQRIDNHEHQPTLRVQVELKQSQDFRVQRESAGLRLLFAEPARRDASAPLSVPVMKTEIAPPKTAPAAVVTPQQPPDRSNASAWVSGLSIKVADSGATLVDVATTRPASYRSFRLENPPRLVVDLEGATEGLRRRNYSAQSPLLAGVRVRQFRASNPAVVRVVADLAGDPVSSVFTQPGGVRIELKSRNAELPVAPQAASSALGKPEPSAPLSVPASAPKASVEQPKPAIEKVQTEVVARQEPVVRPADAGHATDLRPDYPSALPSASDPKDVAAAPRPQTPAEVAQAPESLKAARAAQTLAASSPDFAAPQGQKPGAAGTSSAEPKYTGEPISLNLKDVELKDFFRLIHEISGLNIIIDPNVSGSVTLVLDNVPWDQALDIVLKNNGLGKTMEGNVLRISRIETLTAEQEGQSKLAAAAEEAQPLVTRFVPVNYAKATTISSLLKSWVGGGALSKRGNILVDDRSNTLIISDIASQIPIIVPIIAKLDTKTKQIEIDARIVLATKAFTRDIEGALNAGGNNKSSSVVTGGTIGTGASATGIIPTAGSTARTALGQTSVAGFGAYVLSNQGARYFLNVMLAAAETKSEAKTLTEPKIVTQNNVLGTVTQGVQIPIQTSINLTVTIQYVNAALVLAVTPQVTDDGHVFMNIKVDNSAPGVALTGAGPSINTQSATTQVLVPDGGTVIFGGITVNASTKAATYVPLLGQIPVLGHLFKSSNSTSNNNELLFFVSPKVLPD